MAWTQRGSLKGPKGETGSQGEIGPEGPRGPQGESGEQGAQGPDGPEGPRGPRGEDGKGITVAGQVATYADLPTDLTTGDAGAAYIVEASGLLYVWTGTAFPPQGAGVQFVGPEGPEGAEGPQGDRGPQGVEGAQGQRGVQGAEGAQGARGSKWFTGSGTPGTVTGSAAGDMYLDTTSGTVYELV
ncbi:hypothetical protein [Corynebacterium sp. AOP12-C2-36]|uniref:hypothetical protein n=1 Tax=Corynebacterium sp. AOP12-C2-36 TaxID=3457723 RepID=UPI004034E248